MKKTSPRMNVLQLVLGTENLDSFLDAIFALDQITNLYLIWNQMSLYKIKSALKKQGGKKRWEFVDLGYVDQEMNDDDILEICYYLPSLNDWNIIGPGATLTVDGAREWKRICPRLTTVMFGGEGLSAEVKEVMRELGVTEDDDDE
jgi:hypothetical protein